MRYALHIWCVVHMTNYMFGKKPKRVDGRTLKFAKFLVIENLPSLQDTFDVDGQFTNMVDKNMYGNDTLGDCVMAGRGHMTLRFEDFEQATLIPVTTKDVENEYFKETGGVDSGLDMLTSLNEWRQQGWLVSDKHTYTIHAYAEVNVSNHNELKYCVMLLFGCYTGFNVPKSAMDQFNAGKIWDVVANDGGIEGGHCVYIVAYNTIGPICITWGQRQQMTWAFWDKYFDEAYAVIDNTDSWANPATDPLNITLLGQELAAITGTPPTPTPTPPTPTTTFTITASVGKGGSIKPSGAVKVTQGANQSFKISAKPLYKISKVTINGKSIGAVKTYSFVNVQANGTISATFKCLISLG